MKENEIKLIKDLLHHYDQNQEISDEFLKSLTENYGNIRGILMNIILKYDPEAEITDEYLDAKLKQYKVDLNNNIMQNDVVESKEEDVVSSEINEESHEKPKRAINSSNNKKRKWIIPIVILSLVIILLAVLFLLKSNNSEVQENTVEEIENESKKEYINRNKLVDKENVKGITSDQNTYNAFNIRIKDGKNNINIRKEPINGSVIGKVSENEFYTVSEEYKSEKPIFLLNKKMILTDIQSEEKVKKPKNFKLNNVQSIDNYTYYAEVMNMDKTINKVRVKKTDVEISYSNWYYLSELDAWIYSEFCEKLN